MPSSASLMAALRERNGDVTLGWPPLAARGKTASRGRMRLTPFYLIRVARARGVCAKHHVAVRSGSAKQASHKSKKGARRTVPLFVQALSLKP